MSQREREEKLSLDTHSIACTAACTSDTETGSTLTVEALAAALLKLPATERARLAAILTAGQGKDKAGSDPAASSPAGNAAAGHECDGKAVG
jgi:hypothetical protein